MLEHLEGKKVVLIMSYGTRETGRLKSHEGSWYLWQPVSDLPLESKYHRVYINPAHVASAARYQKS